MCLAAAPMLMAAGKPVRLEPSSQWIVDYADESCRLVRSFGEGSSKTFFQLESDSPGDVDMVLIGKPLEAIRRKSLQSFFRMRKPRRRAAP
jgi:hypothetical protein